MVLSIIFEYWNDVSFPKSLRCHFLVHVSLGCFFPIFFAIIGVISTRFLFGMKILMFSENKPNEPNQSQSEILQDNETTKATVGLVDSKKHNRTERKSSKMALFSWFLTLAVPINGTDKAITKHFHRNWAYTHTLAHQKPNELEGNLPFDSRMCVCLCVRMCILCTFCSSHSTRLILLAHTQLESAEIEIDWHFVIVVGRFHSFRFVSFRFIKLSPVVNCWCHCYERLSSFRVTVEIFFERYVRHM